MEVTFKALARFTAVTLCTVACGPRVPPAPDLSAAESDCESLLLSAEYTATVFEFVWDSATEAQRADLQATVLVEYPAALRFVVDHRELFDMASELEEIEPGTVIDGLDALDGCWGRIETVVLPDGSAAWVNANALVLDLAAGRYELQDMMGVDGGVPCFGDARPIIRVHRAEILAMQADHLQVRFTTDDTHSSAGLEADGRLTLHPVGLFGVGFNAGFESSQRFTVSDDVLETAEGSWFRFDCPGEQRTSRRR